MFQVTDSYPGDAAGGCDYITKAAPGLIYDDPNSPSRQERVVVTPTEIDFEGRLCIGERTVRHMAHLLGMFEGEAVEMISAENASLRDECARGQVLLADAAAQLSSKFTLNTVYVCPDGFQAGTMEGALLHMGAPVVPVPVPAPLDTESESA